MEDDIYMDINPYANRSTSGCLKLFLIIICIIVLIIMYFLAIK